MSKLFCASPFHVKATMSPFGESAGLVSIPGYDVNGTARHTGCGVVSAQRYQADQADRRQNSD